MLPGRDDIIAGITALATRSPFADLGRKADELERIAREEEALRAEAQVFLVRLRQRSEALTEDFQRVTGRSLASGR
ncbi:MAG: hypothetical protein U0359_12850 [Byssovorax sp.]